MATNAWPNKFNAPLIPSWLLFDERMAFAGDFIGALLYGVATALFFQCIVALLDPIDRAGGRIKWWLVAHTAAMFASLTLSIAVDLYKPYVEYIDNRDFPGVGEIPPGPLGYYVMIYRKAIFIVHLAMFPLNQWLADGFLLYRCFIIYSKSYWAIGLPCLIYLTSIGMGVAQIYTYSKPEIRLVADANVADTAVVVGQTYAGSTPEITLVTHVNIVTSCYSICLGLNILLTLMIVARLILHRRNFRDIARTCDSTSGPYTTIITIIVESCALYSVALLLYIVPWAIGSSVVILFKTMGAVQVIAPYLITIRVANRAALTSDMVNSRSSSVSSMQFGSQGEAGGDVSLPDEGPTGLAEPGGEGSREPSSEAEGGIKQTLR